MMIGAVCIRCGEAKREAWAVCSGCGWKPESPDDVARSVYLSEHRVGLDDIDVPDLVEAQRLVKSGDMVYPPGVIRELATLKHAVDEMPAWRFALMAFYPLLCWLVGLAVVFGLLLGLGFLVKWGMKAAGWI